MFDVFKKVKRYFEVMKPKKKYYIPMFLLSFIIALLGAFLSWVMALIISNIASSHFQMVVFLVIFTFVMQIVFRALCSLHSYFYALNKNYNIRGIFNLELNSPKVAI